MKITIDFDGELAVTITEDEGSYIFSVNGAVESYGDLIFPETKLGELSEFVTRSGVGRLTPKQIRVLGAVFYSVVNPNQVARWIRRGKQ